MTSFDPMAYGRDIADIYDVLYPGGGPDAAAAAAATARLAAGRPVLELGIGTGRMAFPLRDAGLDVHGLEISPEMIDRLREADPDGTITPHLGDMTDFDLGRTFGVVALFSDGLYALPTQDQQVAAITQAARHLDDDGRLLVETTWPGLVHKHASGTPAAVRPLPDEGLIITTPYHKPLAQASLYVHSVLGPGSIRTVREFFRAVWPGELDLMARLAGLRLDARWSDWSAAPVPEEPGRIISIYAPAGAAR